MAATLQRLQVQGMHLGSKPTSACCIRDGSAVKELTETKEEKDLGVYVTPDLNRLHTVVVQLQKPPRYLD